LVEREGGRQLRRRVLEALNAGISEQAIDELGRRHSYRRLVRPLLSLLPSGDPTVKWRAVMALGIVVTGLAEEDLEEARGVLRKLMWNLTEESGNIAWGAPEAMGEILARNETLANEFPHILVSYIREDGNFLEHIPLQRGVLWALERLAEVRPEKLHDLEAAEHVAARLKSEDTTVRALAAKVLGLLRVKSYRSALVDLCKDEGEASICSDGTEVRRRVCDVAREAIMVLDSEG